MATANEIIVGARLRIGVHSLGEEVEAEESQIALDTLNDMLFEWASRDLIKKPTAAYTLSDVVSLVFIDKITTPGTDLEITWIDEASGHLKNILAVKLTVQYSMPVSAKLASAADTSTARITGFSNYYADYKLTTPDVLNPRYTQAGHYY